MAGQLIPPPELAPPSPEHLNTEQCLSLAKERTSVWQEAFPGESEP
jgi:hypothetical protein